MRKIKIYLDTSVINFLLADDSPELKNITHKFFAKFAENYNYEIYISEVVVDEIEATTDPAKKELLLDVLRKYSFKGLRLTEECEKLAKKYIENKVIPEKKMNDALHIALTTINNIDILLSWNYKHLANYNKQLKIRLVNESLGYFYPITLTNPMEVLDEDD